VAVEENLSYLFSLGFKEIGALKADATIEVSAGGIKTNYGESQKIESSFVLVSTKNNDYGSNVNAAIAAHGMYVDQVVIDVLNGFIYESRNVKIASGAKIQGTKTPEMALKNSKNNFTLPLKAVNIVGGTGEVISSPGSQI